MVDGQLLGIDGLMDLLICLFFGVQMLLDTVHHCPPVSLASLNLSLSAQYRLRSLSLEEGPPSLQRDLLTFGDWI